jgi:hypothetical protein
MFSAQQMFRMQQIGKLITKGTSAVEESWNGTKMLTKVCALWLGGRTNSICICAAGKIVTAACAFFNHSAHMSQRKAALKVI